MFERLKRALGGPDGGFVECRRCGCTVDDPTARCGECGSREVARYDI